MCLVISSNLNFAVIGSFLEIIADEKLLFSADATKINILIWPN